MKYEPLKMGHYIPKNLPKSDKELIFIMDDNGISIPVELLSEQQSPLQNSEKNNQQNQ